MTVTSLMMGVHCGGCAEQSWVCNGLTECGDWSDENICLNAKNINLYCRNDECVERSKVNDEKVDMTGGYDEFICCATQGHKCGCIPGNDNCHYLDAFQVMTIVPHLESAFPTFGSVTQEMIATKATVTNHAKQLKLSVKIPDYN